MEPTTELYRVQLDACLKDPEGFTLYFIAEQRMGVSNVRFGKVTLPSGCPGKLRIPSHVDPVFRTRLGSKPLVTITPTRVSITQDEEVFRFERRDDQLVALLTRTPSPKLARRR